MSKIEIVGAPLSNFVWTARIVAAEKGVDYTWTKAAPRSAEARAIHPLGKVPGLRDGDFTLFETRAICAYLDRIGSGPSLLPDDAKEAALVEQWISFTNTQTDIAIVRNYVLAYLFPGTPDGKPDRARIDAALRPIQKLMDILEPVVSKGWLVGERFSLADAFLIPVLWSGAQFPECAAMLKEHPKLAAYLHRGLGHDSVRKAHPRPEGKPT